MNILNKINKIIFTAGHGNADSGAVRNDGLQERETTRKICLFLEEIAKNNNNKDLQFILEDRDNKLNLSGIIQKLNTYVKSFNNKIDSNTLCIEIHQDMNAPHLDTNRQNKQMGVYYYQDDLFSKDLAYALRANFIKYGAYNATPNNYTDFNGSWTNGHYLPWRKFYLGFIHNTKALSLIIECGYISGANTDDDLRRFAQWIYSAIVELKSKNINNLNNNQDMTRHDLYTSIKKARFNELENGLEDNLINALAQDNLDYIVAFAGKERLIDQIKKDQTIADLRSQIDQMPQPKMLSEVVIEPLRPTEETFKVKQFSDIQIVENRIQNRVEATESFAENKSTSDFRSNLIRILKKASSIFTDYSWKRFTALFSYIILTIAIPALSEIVSSDFLTKIADIVQNSEDANRLFISLIVYIIGQTSSDIIFKKKK